MALRKPKNQNLMQMIRKVHSLIEEPDVEKQRQTQEHIAALNKLPKNIVSEPVDLEGMYAEWLRPDWPHAKNRVILYCHGGGYMTGSCTYARSVTIKLAQASALDVFCFNYRLAPEHPYPAATEDAMTAWNYLMMLGYGAKDIILAGDSAGGNLALSLSLRLKSENRFLPGGLLLFSPWTDLTASGRSHTSKIDADPILSPEYMQTVTKNYAEGQDLTDPLISPLFGDYQNFPPIYIQVGSNEILYSDSELLYKRILSFHSTVRFETFKGMWHVFQMSPFKTAAEAIEKSAEFIFDIYR
ncbi:MAG: alpha/beta hydrolase [Lachnospiraceae bacterium]|nr:alpha/beta hydrolase [Lachnospiraceae bacterium]